MVQATAAAKQALRALLQGGGERRETDRCKAWAHTGRYLATRTEPVDAVNYTRVLNLDR